MNAKAILSFVLALALLSCALPDPSVESLRISFPEAPESWAALGPLSFALSWRDASGARRETVAGPGEEVEIELRRGGFQALIGFPRGLAAGLAPAGALYPLALEEADPYGREAEPRRLTLSWAGGWLAAVSRRLEAGRLDPEAFDLRGLAGLAGASDPWVAKPSEVALRLAEGRFRSSIVSSPSLFEVELPGPGPWAPESPLAPAPRLLAEGGPLLASLPEGVSLFAGPAETLLVSVDGEGRACAVRRAR